MIIFQSALAQVNLQVVKKLSIPEEAGKFQSLQLLEDGTPVVVTGSGVYSPVDKQWLLPPDAQHPILDATLLKDPAGNIKMCVLQMGEEKVELKALHRIQDGQPRYRTVQMFPLGLFHISTMDSVSCIVWGKEKNNSIIYAVSLQQTKKLLEVNAAISAVQVFTENSLLAVVGGHLVVIGADGAMKPVTAVPAKVISMVVDGRANIWLSTLQGVYVLQNGTKQFIGPMMDNGVGLLQVYQSQIWFADIKTKTLTAYSIK